MNLIERVVLCVQPNCLRCAGHQQHHKQRAKASAVVSKPRHGPACRRGYHAAILDERHATRAPCYTIDILPDPLEILARQCHANVTTRWQGSVHSCGAYADVRAIRAAPPLRSARAWSSTISKT